MWVPAVYSQHSGQLLNAWETGGTPGVAGANVTEMVNAGVVTDTFNFGPPMLAGGAVCASSGGGSTTMVFQGEVLNAASGNERFVVDFVYFK